MGRTALTMHCPTCDDRTTHNRVRRTERGSPGILTLCRDCTDVADELGGKYRLAR